MSTRWTGLAEEYRGLGKHLVDQFECLAPAGWRYTHVLSTPTASCNSATPTACMLACIHCSIVHRAVQACTAHHAPVVAIGVTGGATLWLHAGTVNRGRVRACSPSDLRCSESISEFLFVLAVTMPQNGRFLLFINQSAASLLCADRCHSKQCFWGRADCHLGALRAELDRIQGLTVVRLGYSALAPGTYGSFSMAFDSYISIDRLRFGPWGGGGGGGGITVWCTSVAALSFLLQVDLDRSTLLIMTVCCWRRTRRHYVCRHIRPHWGPTNQRIKAHLGLVIPTGGCATLEVRQLRHHFGPFLTRFSRFSQLCCPDPCRVMCSTQCPCLLDTDRCLTPDAVTVTVL